MTNKKWNDDLDSIEAGNFKIESNRHVVGSENNPIIKYNIKLRHSGGIEFTDLSARDLDILRNMLDMVLDINHDL